MMTSLEGSSHLEHLPLLLTVGCFRLTVISRREESQMPRKASEQRIDRLTKTVTMARTVAFQLVFVISVVSWAAHAFSVSQLAFNAAQRGALPTSKISRAASTTRLFLSDDFLEESADDVQEKIQALVESHSVLLFMKGSKLFPQCGFSNNAVQILNSFGVTFHAVDVLADQSIREGVKVFSQWPTIPQLYIQGEFIGGSDIMIEM
jgi:monothiol glutaredoxin